MLMRSKLKTQRHLNAIFIWILIFLVVILTVLTNYIDSQLMLRVSIYINTFVISLISTILFILTIIWFMRNKAYKGIKYARYHYFNVLKLRKAFLDAGYYNKRFYFGNEVAILPKIKIIFSDNFSKAKLLIENINIHKDIGNVNISFALNEFVVDRSYLSKDENYYVFEIFDSNVDQQLKFDSIYDFKKQTALLDDYTLFIDNSTNIDIFGTLIVGQTGSGKTYALYSLILQMLMKNVHYNLYFADPKNSSLAVLGECISKENTVTDIDNIIQLLNKFNEKMFERKSMLKEKLVTDLEGTYADFKFEPHIFIFDEFASFQTVLQTLEKKKRDEVMMLLSQVVLQGRQLGFFLWIIMQKSDATLLPTNLRENLPVKFVLGNAEKQTYTTAFGPGTEIPEKNFDLGQGIFTCPIIANTPSSCHFSYLNFDILKTVKNIKSTTVVL